MNWSSVASNSNPSASSPGIDLFKLKSISASGIKQRPEVEVHLGDYLKKLSGGPLERFSPSEEDLAVNRLFGLGEAESLADVLCNSKTRDTPSQSEKSGLGDEPEQQTSFEAAVPLTKKCLVCREVFENYFQHLSTAAHRKKQKSFITLGKSKVSLEEVIADLVQSLSKQGSEDKLQGEFSHKRSRSGGQVAEDLAAESEPRKRKTAMKDCTPVCVSSLQSTSLINSNSLARKESFFD